MTSLTLAPRPEALDDSHADSTSAPDSLTRLLQAWNHHQDLHFGGASVADLGASRIELDQARSLVRG